MEYQEATRLFSMYLKQVDLENKLHPDIEPTENYVADQLLLMAAHHCIQADNTTQAIIILKIGLNNSKHNFQFMLQLIRLFSHLGDLSIPKWETCCTSHL